MTERSALKARPRASSLRHPAESRSLGILAGWSILSTSSSTSSSTGSLTSSLTGSSTSFFSGSSAVVTSPSSSGESSIWSNRSSIRSESLHPVPAASDGGAMKVRNASLLFVSLLFFFFRWEWVVLRFWITCTALFSVKILEVVPSLRPTSLLRPLNSWSNFTRRCFSRALWM